MEPEKFRVIAKKIRPYTRYIYLHLLGEPLLHPKLKEILAICRELDFKVTIVTNGTLIENAADTLMNCGCLYKICYSLHSFEANAMSVSPEEYLAGIVRFAKISAEKGVINVFKLWNGGGENTLNERIIEYLGFEYKDSRFEPCCGTALPIYLDFADKFFWPDMNAGINSPRFCMGLRDQIGVLCDGKTVPCCLDAEGEIKLGNLFTDSMEEILNCERALNIKKGFSEGRAAEELCRRCDFAKRRFG